MARRLKRVLPDIVHTDQTRTIFQSIFRLRDIAHHACSTNINAIMISIDQEKAFDRVNHRFLLHVLRKFNFGQSFIHWITTLYSGATCRILNNGWHTDTITLYRGLRQGCPLSPLLYILTAETLGNAIRNNEKIHGILRPGGQGAEDKVTQYADDTTLTLSDDQSV